MRKPLTLWNLVAVIAISWCQFASTGAAQDKVEPQAILPAPLVVDMPLPANQHPNVFYNYYLQPSMDGTAASMYPSPMPVPARVGHTHYTYQPLLPHEHMYRHRRVYYTPHGTRDMFYTDPCTCKSPGRTYTKTTVTYTHGMNLLNPMPIRLPSFSLKGMKRACGATCE